MERVLTIKNILNSVEISVTTYLIILLSFLAGYFEIVVLCLFIILVHEMGHFLSATLMGLNVKNVKIFMFGGVTTLNESLNLSIYKEIIMLLFGPITQIIFVYIIYLFYKNGLVSSITFQKVSVINKVLLSFNLLPILPLDGGKLLNNLLDIILPLNLSHLISIIVGFISLPLVFLVFNKLLGVLIFVQLFVHLIEEVKFHKYKLTYLLLERKTNDINFKKSIKIKNIKGVYRNKNYFLEC